jgi:BirA family transcriptional regulator, biotin operon repressor / biotin---[acetyl-CoA-carboxylase] ligase
VTRVALGEIARAQGVRLLSLGTVDSTNDEARRLIEAGERGPLWVIAVHQTQGRGRLGRTWLSPQGNLHASLILNACDEASLAPQLGFVAGVATLKALRHLCPRQNFALKWPNDLLLSGDKIGGILLENIMTQTGDARQPTTSVSIIGIGINCENAPEGLPYPTRALKSLGVHAPSVLELTHALTDAFVAVLALWRRGLGFAQIRNEWLSCAAGLGQEIHVMLADETLVGRFEEIDSIGRLVLSGPKGKRLIEAGDVLLGPRPVVTETLR